MYSAMLHRQAVYWLDLMSKGWWGRDDNATMVRATDAIWSNASHVLTQWNKLLSSASVRPDQWRYKPKLGVAFRVHIRHTY